MHQDRKASLCASPGFWLSCVDSLASVAMEDETEEMPIAVYFQNIDGTQRYGVMADGYRDLRWPIGDASFPLLQYVDPYGDAVFKRAQMPEVLRELDVLMNRCSDEHSKALLRQVQELAKGCQDSPHTYLRFVGD